MQIAIDSLASRPGVARLPSTANIQTYLQPRQSRSAHRDDHADTVQCVEIVGHSGPEMHRAARWVTPMVVAAVDVDVDVANLTDVSDQFAPPRAPAPKTPTRGPVTAKVTGPRLCNRSDRQRTFCRAERRRF
jgi:hypothetical protein